ncbi:MAG TPA: anti-sigma factor antagonist [Acidimicrobiales bacterium]|nr:anti-sigma factor antagonist [Acidimicrobiales bacterium]
MPITPLFRTRRVPLRADGRLGAFAIRIDFAERTVVVGIRGELDALTAPMVRATIDGLEEQGHTRITLDLSTVTFLAAGGLGLIAGTAAQLRRAGGDLTLRSPSAQVLRILDITGISGRLAIEDPGPLLALHADLVRSAWGPTREDIVDDKLRKVVTIAAKAIVGADGVSVSLTRGGRVKTVAASNDTVLRMDDHQYGTGEGPCLAAAADGVPFDIERLGDDERWPTFVPLAIAEGIASILSTPLLTDDGSIGALNIYSSTAGAFGAHQRELAVVFATHASEIVAGADLGLSEDELDERIADALQSRTVLALAQGILMARSQVSADQASALLHRAARDEGTSTLRQASEVVASTRGPTEDADHA